MIFQAARKTRNNSKSTTEEEYLLSGVVPLSVYSRQLVSVIVPIVCLRSLLNTADLSNIHTLRFPVSVFILCLAMVDGDYC